MIAFDRNASRPYSLKRDTGAQKTIFHLGMLDVIERARTENYLIHRKDIPESERVWRFHLECVRHGLRGWEDLIGPDGQPIAMIGEVADGGLRTVSDKSLALLAPTDIRELGMQIANDNFAPEVDTPTDPDKDIRLALAAWFDPSVLQGDHGVMLEDSTGRQVTPAALVHAYERYHPIIEVIDAIDRGIITISVTEYQQMPALIMDYLRLYRETKTEHDAKRKS